MSRERLVRIVLQLLEDNVRHNVNLDHIVATEFYRPSIVKSVMMETTLMVISAVQIARLNQLALVEVVHQGVVHQEVEGVM